MPVPTPSSKTATSAPVTVGALVAAFAAIAAYVGRPVDPQVLIAAPVVIGAAGHGVAIVEAGIAGLRARRTAKASAAEASARASAEANLRALAAELKPLLADVEAVDPKITPAVEHAEAAVAEAEPVIVKVAGALNEVAGR